MKNSKIKKLTTCAVMLALSFVLSFVKIYEFPFGGSITLLSMLPICLVSIKYGLGWGFSTAFCYSLLQFFVDLGKAMSWGLTAKAWVGMIIFDYLLAFTALGIAGLFRKRGRAGHCLGVALAIVARFISSVLSGAIVWESVGEIFGLNITNTWVYSLLYNGAYMLPELAITCTAIIIMTSVTAFSKLIKPEN